ncbi:protein kinase domain-containing protein [Saccharibacillus alkalitolerans]|uniref:Serine/threonine protein kinase n=1 Tax=Saccharibacillus alkalitolerans TaxID=2705290 RepID=A0ABX0FB43_9BACL|nr:serine/threonine protein kinase [Saccharibacillus alkalitolerans]NGZ78142.1 serine/threonine protein kinase [Saccharibacillus alkalitolerans]
MAAPDLPGFTPGTVVTGASQGGQYTIQSLIGRGSNGNVYLVRTAGGQQAALKAGPEKPELKAEVEVLAELKKHELDRGSRRPFLLDADRFKTDGRSVPFYVMKFVRGVPIDAYIRKYGYRQIGAAGLGLLDRLSGLHQAGFIFGDLKPCHVLVEESGGVELVDYGGATSIGGNVKQYSGWYDRKYWNAGSRTADPGYDLFAFAVLCLHVFDERGLRRLDAALLPQTRSPEDLVQLAGKIPALRPFEPWLDRALRGGFVNSREAHAYWNALCRRLPADGRKGASKLLAAAFCGSLLLLAAVLYTVLSL